MTTNPSHADAWAEFWATVGNESWLFAWELIELSPALLSEARTWVRRRGRGIDWDWQGWLASYDGQGRGWSCTEHRLFAVVASLLDDERPLRLDALRGLGSWEVETWRVLLAWRAA